MKAIKIAAIVLIVAGVLGLVYGGITYTREAHDIELGPVEIVVGERQTAKIPVWAGVGAIAAGSVLLLFGRSRSSKR